MTEQTTKNSVWGDVSTITMPHDGSRWHGAQGAGMQYRNLEMKLDQLIGYFNAGKINLIPPFQRGHAWKLPARQKLLENMVQGRPIPAIFLYRQEDGSQFSYNILDGKQRLESLILFIGNTRSDLAVTNIKDYFVSDSERKQINFPITLDKRKVKFKKLPDELVRDFREYSISTIQIDLDDEDSSLDEIINLFVDINQRGTKVSRFDIVKAIGQDNKLLRGVLDLVADSQTRKRDKFFKVKNNAFTRVLQRLPVVQGAADKYQRVDRMWERLVEITLFNRTKSHRQAGQVVRAFIKTNDDVENKPLSSAELGKLKQVFGFLDKAYLVQGLGQSRLARDLPLFYTMVTTLLSSQLLEPQKAPPAYPEVRSKLVAFANLLADGAAVPRDIEEPLAQYKQAATRQTTHPGRRRTRQESFEKILEKL